MDTGGLRATADRERARYDSQVVFVDRAEVVERMRALASAHGVSLARVLRDVVRAGLPRVEAAYAALDLDDDAPELALATAVDP